MMYRILNKETFLQSKRSRVYIYNSLKNIFFKFFFDFDPSDPKGYRGKKLLKKNIRYRHLVLAVQIPLNFTLKIACTPSHYAYSCRELNFLQDKNILDILIHWGRNFFCLISYVWFFSKHPLHTITRLMHWLHVY